MFGYEGQTNNLKIVGTGDGGLEEMIDQLSSSHIMYAFCKVIDTKTSLPKCLLINWVSLKRLDINKYITVKKKKRKLTIFKGQCARTEFLL